MPSVVVDVGAVDISNRTGAVWSLPHGGDLDVNLVHLDAGRTIGSHVNDEVDVVLVVLAGSGEVTIGGAVHQLRVDVLAAIPKGAGREVRAGSDGLTYLSIHRQRGPLNVVSRGSQR